MQQGPLALHQSDHRCWLKCTPPLAPRTAAAPLRTPGASMWCLAAGLVESSFRRELSASDEDLRWSFQLRCLASRARQLSRASDGSCSEVIISTHVVSATCASPTDHAADSNCSTSIPCLWWILQKFVFRNTGRLLYNVGSFSDASVLLNRGDSVQQLFGGVEPTSKMPIGIYVSPSRKILMLHLLFLFGLWICPVFGDCRNQALGVEADACTCFGKVSGTVL